MTFNYAPDPPIGSGSNLESAPVDEAFHQVRDALNAHKDGTGYRHAAGAVDVATLPGSAPIAGSSTDLFTALDRLAAAVGRMASSKTQTTPATRTWATAVTGLGANANLDDMAAFLYAATSAATANALVQRNGAGDITAHWVAAEAFIGPLNGNANTATFATALTGGVRRAMIADLGATQNTPTATLRVLLAGGEYFDANGAHITITAGTPVDLPAADATRTRIDLVSYGLGGAIHITQGAPAATNAQEPALPQGDVPGFAVLTRPGATAILTTDSGAAGTGYILNRQLPFVPAVGGGSGTGGAATSEPYVTIGGSSGLSNETSLLSVLDGSVAGTVNALNMDALDSTNTYAIRKGWGAIRTGVGTYDMALPQLLRDYLSPDIASRVSRSGATQFRVTASANAELIVIVNKQPRRYTGDLLSNAASGASGTRYGVIDVSTNTAILQTAPANPLSQVGVARYWWDSTTNTLRDDSFAGRADTWDVANLNSTQINLQGDLVETTVADSVTGASGVAGIVTGGATMVKAVWLPRPMQVTFTLFALYQMTGTPGQYFGEIYVQIAGVTQKYRGKVYSNNGQYATFHATLPPITVPAGATNFLMGANVNNTAATLALFDKTLSWRYES